MAKLTKERIEKFTCPSGRKQAVLWCSELRGFGVRATDKGVKTYILQFRVKGTGQERQRSLGRYNDVTLYDARAEAEALKNAMRKGVDPAREERRQREEREAQEAQAAAKAKEDVAQRITLREVMEEYLLNKHTDHGPLRPASKRDIERHMTVNLADWLDEPVATITREKCLARFHELSERAPGQANQCFINLRALLNRARENHSDGDNYPLLPFNPVERMFKLRKMNKEEPRDRRVPIEKVGAVWHLLDRRRASAHNATERTAVDLVQFLMLTGCRKIEAASLTWDRVYFNLGTFVIPKEIAKNHNALTFPLTPMLRELLERRPHVKGSPYVFASWGKKSPYIGDPRGAMEAVSQVAEWPPTPKDIEKGRTYAGLSPHDLRRTFDDIAKRCKVGEDERWKLLNHVPGADVHRKHYANIVPMQALREAVESMHDWIKAEATKAATAHAAKQQTGLPEAAAL